MDSGPFLQALDGRVRDILEACTKCGKCVEVCPMPAHAAIEVAAPGAVVAGVLDILEGGQGSDVARAWANACTGSGHCIEACDYGVNPRFMLAMARLALKRAGEIAPQRAAGVTAFRKMSRGVRILSRLQLPATLLQRLSQLRAEEPDEPQSPDIVFYTGCNILKTPHIALLCLDVMDALGVSYRVMGGPGMCCGILQFRAGDGATSSRVSTRAIERFADTGSGKVLSWCPSCQIQIGEIALPTYARATGATPFDMAPFVLYLADRLDDLKRLMVGRVEKRVGLHEHPGTPGVPAAVRRILEAIPGLEFVDLAQPRIGYMCSAVTPAMKRDLHGQALEAAAEAGVTTLAGVYHSCHRDLCAHERDWPFEVVNFMELIGASMGLERPDLFKRLKVMQDVDRVIAETHDLIAVHDLDLDEVRQVIARDMLGEQSRPLGRGGEGDEA
jgi:heterodisulfide reductase subunit D